MQSELIHTETREGWDIAFYACEEDMDPADCFDNEDDIVAVRNGDVAWFCAKVTASKEGAELGCTWLGACAYASAADFVDTEGYYDDMVAEAIEEGKAKLARLCAS